MRDLLQKIRLRELRMLLLGIAAIVTTGTVVGLVIPNAKALRAAISEVRILEESGRDAAALERHLQEQHVKIEDLKYRLHGDMANLPVRQVEAYIIGRLQRVSWSNDVDLVSVEPAMGDRVQIFQEILFNVQLVGQYEDLYGWLLEAREELGFVVIKEYELKRQDTDDTAPRLLADLSLALYRAVQ